MSWVRSRRNALAMLALAVLSSPLGAAPHERWVPHRLLSPYDETPFREWTPLGAALLLGTLALLAFGAWYSQRLPRVRLQGWLPEAVGPKLMRVTTGVSLLLLAHEGLFLAPDLAADGSIVARLLLGLTFVGAIGLISDWRSQACSLLLLAAFLAAVVLRPFQAFDGEPIRATNVLMYFEILAILAYVIRAAPGSRRRRLQGTRWVQRVVGANILLHGALKVVAPDLPVGVVQNHASVLYDPIAAWIPLEIEGFVLCAATVEVLLGSALLLGILPELALVTLVLVVTATAFVFRGDLLGHLPRTGAVLVMLLVERPHLDRRAELLARVCNWQGRRPPRLGPVSLRAHRALLLPLGLALTVGAALPPRTQSEPTPAPLADAAEESYRPPPSGLPREGLVLGRRHEVPGHRGQLRFALEPLSDPGIGQLFDLGFQVTRPDGSAYQGELQVHIGMPRHGHGMPTKPVLRSLGQGRYLQTGCQLNMFGLWTFHIVAPDEDEVVFELRHCPRIAE